MKKFLGVSLISLLAFTTLPVETPEAAEVAQPNSTLIETKTELSEKNKFTQPKSILTEDEVRNLLNDFLTEKKSPKLSATMSDEFVDYAVDSGIMDYGLRDTLILDEFVDYAVDSGAIYNTMESRASVAITAVRLQFEIVVLAGKVLGLSAASELLNHSLQDSPKDLNYASGTAISDQVKNSTEAKKIVSEVKEYVKGKKLSSYVKNSSTTLNSTQDLYLALNRVSYTASSKKDLNTGKWTTTITFEDEYDFDPNLWKNVSGLKDAAKTALINYAVDAERIGAIVPYDVKITTTHTFYE